MWGLGSRSLGLRFCVEVFPKPDSGNPTAPESSSNFSYKALHLKTSLSPFISKPLKALKSLKTESSFRHFRTP